MRKRFWRWAGWILAAASLYQTVDFGVNELWPYAELEILGSEGRGRITAYRPEQVYRYGGPRGRRYSATNHYYLVEFEGRVRRLLLTSGLAVGDEVPIRYRQGDPGAFEHAPGITFSAGLWFMFLWIAACVWGVLMGLGRLPKSIMQA